MPPAPLSVDDYLRSHILPRTDCAKCVVARGPDATVRSLFASEGGKGRSRNVSAKRACPLATHAISASGDGVPLLEKYESDYGVKLTNKKQKVNDFMQNTYGVERLGQAPSYKVTLYTPPHVASTLPSLWRAVTSSSTSQHLDTRPPPSREPRTTTWASRLSEEARDSEHAGMSGMYPTSCGTLSCSL
eukprot:2045348-Prymnesium_polylepis.1